MVIHKAKTVVIYGEERIKTLCGRSRATIINISSLESGQNITNENNNVTCSYCKKNIVKEQPLLR